MIQTHARRLPLLDADSETGHEVIVSVLTQYRLLKYIAINVSYRRRPSVVCLLYPQCAKDVQHLHMPLRKLKIGTYVAASPSSSGPSSEEGDSEKIRENPYYPIATATMQTRVFDVVHMFSERGISAVPIIDDNGVVVNLYETVDVIVSSSIEIFGAETNG